jgi:hypothetical protein
MASQRTIGLPPAPDGPDRPVVLARVYPGIHVRAVELFQIDAEDLAIHGYLPVAQSYAEGRYSPAFVAMSTILVLFLVGLLLLLYMAAVRPPGNLAVTYMLRDAVR